MADGKLYTAFISYSQADKAWGKRIHNWLETYRVPVGVMVDVSTDRRLGRFFRDEEEMPAATDIAAVVRRAIEVAESLIVICSPRSAQSQWVESEIEYFRRANPDGKIFAVIIDGEPNGDDPAKECFPRALRVVTDPADEDAMPMMCALMARRASARGLRRASWVSISMICGSVTGAAPRRVSAAPLWR